MESIKFKFDLGNPMLCFMCPKCFGVTHIDVKKHKLRLSTMGSICMPDDVINFTIGKNPEAVEFVYRNLVRMVHNCDQNTDHEPMVSVNPLLGDEISAFNRLGFNATHGVCRNDGANVTTKPFIEFDISYDDPQSNDIKNQLSAAIIAARDFTINNDDNTNDIDRLVMITMHCDFELMSIGQHLRITCDPLSIDPGINIHEIPLAFAYALDEVLSHLDKSAAIKPEDNDDVC